METSDQRPAKEILAFNAIVVSAEKMDCFAALAMTPLDRLKVNNRVNSHDLANANRPNKMTGRCPAKFCFVRDEAS
jgi:hypothetical protein